MSSHQALTRVLTLGTFDGVHLGHRHVIEETVRTAKTFKYLSEIVTFTHPPDKSKPLITFPDHKMALIATLQPDTITSIEFTPEFSQMTAEDFLLSMKPHTLILGYDAKIGKERSGDPQHLEHLSKKLHFNLRYLPPVLFNDLPISSSRVRNAIQAGDLELVKNLLGRPYSIRSHSIPGEQRGRLLGCPTLNIDVSSLVLPPLGVWAVTLNGAPAIANLGYAPTFHRQGPALLEVHLLDPPLPNEPFEVTFKAYLRPEITFPTPEALKQQIALDIEQAKLIGKRTG